MSASIIPASSQDAPEPVVTLVTALASALDIPDAEYRQIYARVAAGRSLRNIELALRSGVSYGWWAKYATGDKDLDRDRKNELRRWSRENGGPALPDLPPTPAEAVAANVHPDAVVYRVGVDQASRVVLVGADVPAIGLRINGNCTVASAAPPPILPETVGADQGRDAPVPTCNTRYRVRGTKSLSVSRSTWKRASAARQASGLTWDAYVARAELVDELVAALVAVDSWLEPDPDALSSPETWGEMERLAVTVRNALDAVRESKP